MDSQLNLPHGTKNRKKTRSTGTVHASAKASLISDAIWQISMNECPLNIFRISQTVSPDRHQNWKSFIHSPIANLPWKFHANPFGNFLRKVASTQTSRQTDRQTNNDVSSMADV